MPNDTRREMERMPDGMERQNESRPIGGQQGYNVPAPRMAGMPDEYRREEYSSFPDMYRSHRRDRMNKSEKNAFKQDKHYKQYRTADEVFQTIIEHLTKGVMFHDKMMDLFGFLGLYGFKKIHEYQYFSESIERRKAKCYVLEHMNLLVKDKADDVGLNFIPDAWYQYSRHDVTPEARKQYISPAFEAYRQWEEETKELLSYCANELMTMGQMSDFNEVMEMVEDVEEEIRKLEDLIHRLTSVDFDMQHLMDMQEKICHEYEEKLEELFEEKIEHDKKKKNYIGAERTDERRYGMMMPQRRSSYTGRFIR